LISFGHAAYFAVGAYACAILLTRLEWPFLLAFPSAIVMAGVVALAIGYFCVKLTEVYFAMLTLASAQLVWAVAFKWSDVTGGDTGFIGVAVPEFLKDPTAFYYFALAVVSVCIGLLWTIVRSAFGRTLIAVRENAVRAEFIGVNVKRMQLVAFVISGTFAGVAGALSTLYTHSVFVESAWWAQSAEVLIMTVLGGMHSFIGPIIGAAALILLDRMVSEMTEYWPTVLALILLCVLFFFPQGLAGMFMKKVDLHAGSETPNAANNQPKQVLRRLFRAIWP
jgi:branched-chain amino acid transport system permease protein